jgi:hypothetical protein
MKNINIIVKLSTTTTIPPHNFPKIGLWILCVIKRFLYFFPIILLIDMQ